MAANDRWRRYREAADYAKSLGVESRTLIGRGDPTRQILSHAKSLAADLVAMTTHGRSGLERLVAGSVTEGVIRSAECPVLVLRKAAILSRALPMNGVR
jgi:nucleotide-binding universal stress UspA family protein